jgi:hypothetical protein
MFIRLNGSWYWFRNNIIEAGPFATKAEGQAWLEEQEA